MPGIDHQIAKRRVLLRYDFQHPTDQYWRFGTDALPIQEENEVPTDRSTME